MYRHLVYWLIAFFFISWQSRATGSMDSLDSLDAQLANVSGKARVDLLNQLSETYKVRVPTKAAAYAEQAVALASQLHYDVGYATALNNAGECMLNEGGYKRAIALFEEARLISNAIHNQRILAMSLNRIGVVHYFWGNYDQALTYQQKAIVLLEVLNDKKELASALNSLGYIYGKKGLYHQALENHLKALKIREGINNKDEIAKSLNSIGDFYLRQQEYLKALDSYNRSYKISRTIQDRKGEAISLNKVGFVYGKRGNHQKALLHYYRALGINEELGQRKEIATSLQNIGQTHADLKEYRQALHYYQRAFAIYEKLGNTYDIGNTSNQIAGIYILQNNYRMALKYHKLAIQTAFASNSKPLLANAYKAAADTYLQMNDAERFTQLYKLYLPIQDSLELEENNRKIARLQEEYEEDKRKQELALINKEKRIQEMDLNRHKSIRDFLIVLASLTLILAGVLFSFYQLKRKSHQQLTRQNAIILQQNDELSQVNQTLQALNEKLTKSEAELRSSNETKDKFFSIISHDLRGPVATLTAFMSVLLRKMHTFTPEELSEIAISTENSLKNLSSLLNNLLQWSRAQMGNLHYTPEKLSLHDYVQQATALFDKEAATKHIRFISAVDSAVLVNADRNMLGFTLRNLASNAIKFTPYNGEIRISSVVKDEKYVEVAVADTGVGIAEENLQKLFKTNLSFTTRGTANEKGTGLGLLLCKEFVEKNGGSIQVESKTGQGTTFKFTLPLAQN